MFIAKVIIERPVASLDMPFTYYIPSGIEVKEGIRVRVEFNKKMITGYVEEVIKIDKTLEEYEDELGFNLLPIVEVIDDSPIINKELKELASFLAKTTFAPLISCYQAMLPPSLKPTSSQKTSIKYEKWIKVIDDNIDSLTSRQSEVLLELKAKGDIAQKDFPASASIRNVLVDKNKITIYDKEVYRSVYEIPYTKIEAPVKTKEQVSVIEKFLKSDKQVSLLEGVTGSGKTEVYLELTKHYLKDGKNVLILVPEISLTPIMVKRFKERFDIEVAVLHSGLSSGEKYDEYRRIIRNEARIVIGARSAIFAPLTNIGLIVLDEEHSETYKQEITPSYHALNVALERARYHNSKILLGSATPSLETKARALRGVYEHLILPKRIFQVKMPIVSVVDMTLEHKSRNYSHFSRLLLNEMKKTLERKEQIILLLNRRGYSPSVNCKSCGYTFKCPNCDVSLIYHRSDESLKCHYCDFTIPYPKNCPKCGSTYLRNIGAGTQRIEQDLKKLFPEAKILRMDLDTTTKKDEAVRKIVAFDNKEYDILLGTQMISKGFDFPSVTLVGVINADVGLYSGDFRNNERTFQLLVQVVGRSGRSYLPGQAIIQTYNPHNYAIKYASSHDYEKFFYEEMEHRKLGKYPPYTFLTLLTFQGNNMDSVEQVASYIKEAILKEDSSLQVLGPAIPYLAKVNNKYRFRLLIKTRNLEALYPLLESAKQTMLQYRGIDLYIDTSPYQSL